MQSQINSLQQSPGSRNAAVNQAMDFSSHAAGIKKQPTSQPQQLICNLLRRQLSKGIPKGQLDSLNRYVFEPASKKRKSYTLYYNTEVSSQENGSVKVQVTTDGQKLLEQAEISAESLLPKSIDQILQENPQLSNMGKNQEEMINVFIEHHSKKRLKLYQNLLQSKRSVR